MGEQAVLVESGGTAATLALLAALQERPLDRQVGLVPGADTVLVRFDGPVDQAIVAARIRTVRPAMTPHQPDREVAIEVVYDGADLQEVAALTGLGPRGVVTAHTGTPWRVAFCGFSPGFGYLTGGDPRLAVPRRDTPRPRVPAGSVGLAGEYSGAYPAASPGGWQLIGRTSAALWDVRRDPPALLRPGMTVRFRAVREAVTAIGAPHSDELGHERHHGAPGHERHHGAPGHERQGGGPARERDGHHAMPGGRPQGPTLMIVRPGMLCTVQDLGRPGLADMGVSPSGAADRGSADRANRIVGNGADAAVLEILMGGAEFEAGTDMTVAVTGAPLDVDIRAPHAAVPDHGGIGAGASDPAAHGDPGTVGAALAAMDRPIAVPAGARIRLGRPARGLRSYLAVRGGIAVPPVLGSRSSDLLAGIGPAALRRGDRLPIGEERCGAPHPVPGPDMPDLPELEVLPGPQWDWFAPGALAGMREADWTVSPSSNRVGVRLTGPDLGRTVTGELPSQGVVRGAVQVPPSGELVILLADHPVTGGYPVVAVLTDRSADLAAQLRPGQRVRLRLAESTT